MFPKKILLDEEEQIKIEREKEKGQTDLIANELSSPIKSIQMNKIHFVMKDDNVETIIKKFQEESTNAVLVLDNETSQVGIFTEHDFLKKLFLRYDDFNNLGIEDFMTPNPKTLDINTPITVALNTFIHEGFKHIPITQNGEYKYMLTPKDILDYLSCNASKSILNLPPSPLRKGVAIEGG